MTDLGLRLVGALSWVQLLGVLYLPSWTFRSGARRSIEAASSGIQPRRFLDRP